MTYPVPANEALRLRVLNELGILDTAPEQPFEDYTALAKAQFGTEIVAITLLDSQRQWFKSHPGLFATETDREAAFCNYTILQTKDGQFEVPDASVHPTFRTNPLVTGDPYIRYYCGVPITVNSQNIGAFCLIDTRPRAPLSPDEKHNLRRFARLTASQLVARRLLQESVDLIERLSGND